MKCSSLSVLFYDDFFFFLFVFRCKILTLQWKSRRGKFSRSWICCCCEITFFFLLTSPTFFFPVLFFFLPALNYLSIPCYLRFFCCCSSFCFSRCPAVFSFSLPQKVKAWHKATNAKEQRKKGTPFSFFFFAVVNHEKQSSFFFFFIANTFFFLNNWFRERPSSCFSFLVIVSLFFFSLISFDAELYWACSFSTAFFFCSFISLLLLTVLSPFFFLLRRSWALPLVYSFTQT